MEAAPMRLLAPRVGKSLPAGNEGAGTVIVTGSSEAAVVQFQECIHQRGGLTVEAGYVPMIADRGGGQAGAVQRGAGCAEREVM